MKKSNVFSMAIFALLFTAACSSEFQAKRQSQEFVTATGSPHQHKVMDQVAIQKELSKLEIDVTDLNYSKASLDKKLLDSKRKDLETITTLLQKYVDNGIMMIAFGDNDESTVITVEIAKELKKISSSYAVTLSPELNF